MFVVPADAYDRFMGRYATPLAPQFADVAGVRQGRRVLDVGCGPGALTAVLVELVGADAVAAVDPSPPFVEAAAARFPTVDVRQATAEALPFDDASFDAALAQLVVHFMADPSQGVSEMARVTRPGGVVAACVWDHGGGRGPLSAFWEAVRAIDAGATNESGLPGSRRGQLEQLLAGAGLTAVEETELTVTIEHRSFEDWWEPFTLGVGPGSAYLLKQPEERQIEIRERCRAAYPDGPGIRTAVAWAARGRTPA
jgi:SAM-dependent methyltransferase